MSGMNFRRLCVVIGLAWVLSGTAFAAGAEPEDQWPGLVKDIFDNRPMSNGSDVIAIEMPARAEDAATVPVTLRLQPATDASRRVVAVTLVIDNNPAPMAAKFDLGAEAEISEISTRVRINSYTNVHAVAETSDGTLHVAQTYVKASGGCSAPVAKNAELAKDRLGQMRFRQFATSEGSGKRDVQVMVGHPNNSGLQMDQMTQLYIPAFYVDRLELWQDDSRVLTMEGGISISDNPTVRVTYASKGAKSFRAEAKDTEGHQFKHQWRIDGSSM